MASCSECLNVIIWNFYESKNHEKRVNRNNYLTNEQNIFIQVFLSKNKYFYLPNNNLFYEYDGQKYLIIKEDDVIHKLLSTISKDRVLLHKINDHNPLTNENYGYVKEIFIKYTISVRFWGQVVLLKLNKLQIKGIRPKNML
jgi:hypothetical protein